MKELRDLRNLRCRSQKNHRIAKSGDFKCRKIVPQPLIERLSERERERDREGEGEGERDGERET